MRILGIDYGRKKIGLAFSAGSLAEPLKVVHFNSQREATGKVSQVANVEKVEKVVVGVSEGQMGQEAKEFGKKLSKVLKAKVDFADETLTSVTAQRLSIAAGIGKKKRRRLEDAFAACVMLQSYLDDHA